MKDGHSQQLDANQVHVVLTEGDVEVCNLYVQNQTEANKILTEWKAGTYKLLTES